MTSKLCVCLADLPIASALLLQEDYAEAIAKPILKFIEFGGEEA